MMWQDTRRVRIFTALSAGLHVHAVHLDNVAAIEFTEPLDIAMTGHAPQAGLWACRRADFV
jgi:hypothetical protein